MRSSHAPRHIYVVLNDPGPDGEILIVNFTTRRLPRDAKEMVFTGDDYVRLTHPSTCQISSLLMIHSGSAAPSLSKA
jgi:hypothetical protein